MTVSDYPDFIDTSTINALPAPLFQHGTFSVGGGNTHTLGPAQITALGYEAIFSVSIANTSTIPFVTLQVIHTDLGSGMTVSEEDWTLAAGPTGSPCTYQITGPTKGSQVQLAFTNLDPSLSMLISHASLTNSRLYARDRAITTVYNAPPGFTGPGINNLAGIIASVNGATVSPMSSITRLFPVYSGDVWLWTDQQGVAGGSSNFIFQAAPISTYGSAPLFGTAPSGGTSSGVGTVLRLHRGHLLMTFNNQSAGSTATVNCKMIALNERI